MDEAKRAIEKVLGRKHSYRFAVEADVYDDGFFEVTFIRDGIAVAGWSDETGTISTRLMVQSMADKTVVAADEARLAAKVVQR